MNEVESTLFSNIQLILIKRFCRWKQNKYFQFGDKLQDYNEGITRTKTLLISIS